MVSKDEIEEHYEALIDEMFEFKIGDMEYSAANAWKLIDPIAFRLGFIDYVDALEEEEEYVSSGQEERDRQRMAEGRKEMDAVYGGEDDEQPSAKFRMPPKNFQFKREWQKVNKAWINILRK